MVFQLQHQLGERTFFLLCGAHRSHGWIFPDADHILPMLAVSSDVVPPESCGNIALVSVVLVQAFLSRWLCVPFVSLICKYLLGITLHFFLFAATLLYM